MKKSLAVVGATLTLVGGSFLPANAAQYDEGVAWNCDISVSHIGAQLFKTERFCPVGTLWRHKIKVDEGFFSSDILQPVLV